MSDKPTVFIPEEYADHFSIDDLDFDNPNFTMHDTNSAAPCLGSRPATLRDWRKKNMGPPFIRFSDNFIRYPSIWLKKYAELRMVVPKNTIRHYQKKYRKNAAA